MYYPDLIFNYTSMLLLKDLPPEEILLEKYNNPFSDPPLHVNAHFHTPFSFSAFNNMGEIFAQANEEGIDVLGITDFITVDGYDEFYRHAYENKKFPLFNIEFMGLMGEEQKKGIRINDPNNPGRIYFCGKGLSFPVKMNDVRKDTLYNIHQHSLKQTRQMVALLNQHLKKIKAPFKLDFDEILTLYTKGLVRERHLAKALRIKIVEKFKNKRDIQDFLVKLYKGKESQVNFEVSGDLDREIRNNLLKKGGLAFIEEDNDAFLSLQEIKDIILGAQGIPCYPVLLDDVSGKFTDFEKDFDELLKILTKMRVYAVELIPGRNDFSTVKKFVDIFNAKGFLITFGTEHNSPDPAPLKVTCRGQVPLDEDLLAVNYQSACVIAAHQYYVARGRPGYLTPEGFPRLEKQDDFILTGNAVIRNFINL
jgi:hypothetical protein